MSKNGFYNKVLSFVIIFLVSLGLSLTAHTNSYAQYNSSSYGAPWNISYNNNVTPFYNAYSPWNSFYPTVSSYTQSKPKPKPKPKPTTPEEVEKVIATYRVKSAELTGDMLIDFDEERPVGIPRNYDYFLLEGEVYPDIRAYIRIDLPF